MDVSQNLSDHRDQEKLIILLSSPLSAFIILSNLFIIIGIVFNKKLHNTANYFFLSLLFADFFTGVLLPCIPRMKFNKDLGYYGCFLTYISPNFFFLSFLANLLMVHYEKYLCIIYPLRYRDIWVHRCVFPNAYIYLETYGVVIPAILAMSFITIKLLSVARRQLREIKKLHRSVQREVVTEMERQMDLRYAKCIAIFSLTFLICWVPYIALLQVSVLVIENYEISLWIVLTLTCVGSGSAAVIPVILGLSHRQYTELWRNLCKKILPVLLQTQREPNKSPP
ncbi:unnamed protein product [Ranitomeya imitator]|uniref:G-protein coupled bile acid receptor 1 n=1 Tax=Ranitomeya imitator TaxID=111125 RepID=A0ABN9LR45_9NEOB|nr:unnamed protein product [Ranitomeya imitator]